MCPIHRGPLAECGDSDRVWFPLRRVCYPEMERAGAEAAYSALHAERPFHDGTFTRWSDKRTRAFPYHFMEGVKVEVADRDFAPHDEFTTRESASPSPPKGEPGEDPGDKAHA